MIVCPDGLVQIWTDTMTLERWGVGLSCYTASVAPVIIHSA